MTERIHRAKINKSNYTINTQNEDKQVELQNKYTERRYTSRITEQIHRAKINKSNDRTNKQSEDKQVKWQNKYTERR